MPGTQNSLSSCYLALLLGQEYHRALLTGPWQREAAPERSGGVALSVVLNALLILAGETAKWNPKPLTPRWGCWLQGCWRGPFRGF